MNCERVESDDIVERYLRRELSEADQELFERHFFDCQRCLEALESCSVVRVALAESADAITAERPGRKIRPGWAVATGLAAAAAIVVAAWVWRAGPDETVRPGGGAAETNAGDSRSPDPTLRPAADPSRADTLARLARVEPPPYVALTMRNAAGAASGRFDVAMGEYARREYAQAAAHLREASRLNPRAAHISFFLGICSLMIDQPDAAIAAFQQTLAADDPAFEEEAHFYLAKAYLRKTMLEPASAELEATLALRGSRSEEARQLLQDLQPLLR